MSENTAVLKAQDIRTILKRLGSFFLEGQTAYEVVVGGVCYAAENYLQNPGYFGAKNEEIPLILESRKPEKYIIDFIFSHIDEITEIGIMVKDPFLVQMVEKQVHMAAPEVKTRTAGEHRLYLTA